jgi:gas vesicle protein
MNGTSKVLLAALGGAVVGAGLALLFAPASGRETRERLAETANSAKNGVGDLINRGKDYISSATRQAKNEFDRVADEVIDHSRNVKNSNVNPVNKPM